MAGDRAGEHPVSGLEARDQERTAYSPPSLAPGKRTLTANLFGVRPRVPDAAGSLHLRGAPGMGGKGGRSAGAPLLVDDGQPVGPEQMSKSQFLAEAAVIMPSQDPGPWRSQPCSVIEAELRKSIPGADNARSARDYLTAMSSQASQANATEGSAPSALAALLAAPDEAAAADFLASGQLGAGRPLDSGARLAMESAFQHDFGDVRIHTGDEASQLASALDARAFTVGNQIAFGGGLYSPGTPLGDALLAHELAHVVQQRGAPSGQRGASTGMEADADHAAAHVLSALYGGEMSAKEPARPSMKSGLSLQRCPGGGGGGGGGSLTFSSSSFTPGSSGAINTSTTSTDLVVQSSAYSSTGTVQATGGTNSDAAGWDVGYLQTVTSLTPVGHYTRASGTPTQYAITVPNNTRDGNPAGVAPWYDSANPSAKKAFTTTGSTETVSLWDRPQMPFPWDTPDGVGKLASTTGKASFAAWVVVRKRASPNTVQYINWETWEVDFSTTTNYASSGAKTVAGTTGATTMLGSGAGQGSNTPNLTGTVGNNLLTFTWS